MIKKRVLYLFLMLLVFAPFSVYGAAELGKEGIFDKVLNHPFFNLYLPSHWDPVGNNLLRPIEECVPNLDLSGLVRSRVQVCLHEHPFYNLAPGQGEGTHTLMWYVLPDGRPLNGRAGDYGEKVKFRVPVWEQLLELEANYQISNNWRFNAIVNWTYNAAYDVDSNMHHFFNYWSHVNEWKYYTTV